MCGGVYFNVTSFILYYLENNYSIWNYYITWEISYEYLNFLKTKFSLKKNPKTETVLLFNKNRLFERLLEWLCEECDKSILPETAVYFDKIVTKNHLNHLR